MFYSGVGRAVPGDIHWLDYTSPHPMLVVIGTGVAILLSLVGLMVTLVATSFLLIGWIGCISFCRKAGAPQTYQLDRQTTMRLDGPVLSISHPHQQEVVFDLNLLNSKDLYHLSSILYKYWLDAECVWNPGLGEQIEVAHRGVDRFTMLV